MALYYYTLLIIGTVYFTSITVPNRLNSHDWPQAQGQVIGTEVIKKKKNSQTGEMVTVSIGKINYQYEVEDKPYINHQLKWLDPNTDKLIHENLQYPVGTMLTVHYNPTKPNISVLQPSLSTRIISIGLFLLISITVMAFALYNNARKRK